ncbi:MAG: DUF1887 family protein [Clostridiales bacterium]|nr:DUF1887 family protein [Clostridiales bacterium]
MIGMILSKNNIDNLLVLNYFDTAKLMIFYHENNKKVLLRFTKMVQDKYKGKFQITSEIYSTLDDISELTENTHLEYFIFNDLKIKSSLAVLGKLNKETTKIVFYDSENSKIATYLDGKAVVEKAVNINVDVYDYINLAGGDIEQKNNQVFDRLIGDGTLDLILNDYEKWRKFSRNFVNPGIVTENQTKPLYFTIKYKPIDRRDLMNFKTFIAHFVDKGYFKVIAEDMDREIFKFNRIEYKSFFKLSGSWLELLTYKVTKEFKLDDIDASVLFTWDHRIKNFENEIDLLATDKGKLIVVSCKDTKKISKDYLNEINVNSHELGDDNVTKILVTTSHMINDSFFLRANELDIHVIVFDGKYDKFVKNMRDILT